jgi:hypothetical protein
MNYILLKELMKQSETECGFDSDKFAELIVFECIKIAVFKGDSATGKAIKEHFGVEE